MMDDKIAIESTEIIRGNNAALAPHGSHIQPSHVAPQESRTKSSLFSKTRAQLLYTVITSALFGVTAWFAQGTFSEEATALARFAFTALFKVEIGSTLAILRLLQGLLSTCTTFLILNSIELLQWALTGQKRGLRCLSLLGLSSTTEGLGTVGIIFSKGPRMSDRAYAMLRMILLLAIWLSGIILFVKTSVATLHDLVYTYNVTAGVGDFNGSYVPTFLNHQQNVDPRYKYQVLPYTLLSIVSNLVANPMHSISVSPNSGCVDCESFLLTGGLIMTTPWAPTGYTSYPLIKIYDLPGRQVEFRRGIDANDAFASKDCTVFGSEEYLIGIQLCIANSKAYEDSFIAGMYVCANGTGAKADKCVNTGKTISNLTTTFTLYRRQASVLTSRTNMSIISVDNMGPTTRINALDLVGFKSALKWLLDFKAANIPGTSSIAEHFWAAQEQLTNDYWSIQMYQTFQSILVFPLWQFNPNNFGNTKLSARVITEGLDPEFYTKAAVVSQYTKIMVNPSMYIVFLALESFVLAFAWGVLIWIVLIWIWITRPKIPEISSYPLIDFAFKAELRGNASGRRDSSRGVRDIFAEDVLDVGNKEIRAALKDVRVSFRENSQSSFRY